MDRWEQRDGHATCRPPRDAPDAARSAGQWTIDQVHADLDALEQLGVQTVVCDTYLCEPAALAHPEGP